MSGPVPEREPGYGGVPAGHGKKLVPARTGRHAAEDYGPGSGAPRGEPRTGQDFLGAISSTLGRIWRRALASWSAFMVGDTTSPKVSLSNQAHMATLPGSEAVALTQTALPPRAPALVMVAPLKRLVKLVTESAGEELIRLPPMNRMICGVLPEVELPAS